MKASITIWVLLTTVVTSLAQPVGVVAIEDPQFDAQFAQRTIPQVTGKLLHISPQEIKETTITYTLVTLSGQRTKTAQLAADGSFELVLDYPLPYQQIWVHFGELFYTGLYANKQLYVELDIPKLKAAGKEVAFKADGVRYLGDDGPLNEYMNEHILFKRADQLALSSRIQQVRRSQHPVAMEVLAAHTPIFDSLKTIQTEFVATHPSPYAWLLENERLSEFYSQICSYYWGHPMEPALFDQIKKHKTYLLSNSSISFYQYMSTYFRLLPANRVTVNWEDVARLSELTEPERAAIDSLRSTETLSPAPAHRAQWTKQLGPRMRKMYQDRRIAQGIRWLDSLYSPSQADLMKLQLNNSKDIAEQKAALEQILPSMTTNWCKVIAQKEYARTIEQLASANRALAASGNSLTASGFGSTLQQTDFGATLYKLSDMSGADFLAKLKQSFVGKAIVLDRWATWCAPCLQEMPHSKKLQQDAKDLPVVFVYVCTAQGSDEDKWKRKIGELKLPGIHFFIDEALDAKLAKLFSFSGYPGYAFIDQKGVYKPGVITWMSAIKDKNALADLLN
ncbi:TlpA family protein disulfide reductase [Spirosoma sp. KUDC1026]|uniref:TlpA family protein disulfide reductase n=1 Tax=Spirosoma sp. KUDC1026 TaxID=2745947 RepID=UPI00159BE565|nr:TlpA disulfide reductase family protein [Spirosoma sp. KUDC1026]QKZ13412.1 TlpA family protein disulfide reductase [Spirosoma sp. KUDC1026]